MARIRDYKPVEFKQLYMIAKMLLQQEPTIDDAEWKARTKDHLQKLGFAVPDSGMLSRAMTQVENALKETVGPRRLGRPVPEPIKPQALVPEQPQETGRTHRPAGWDIVVKLMGRLQSVAVSSSGSLPRRPEATPLAITEDEALWEFWRQHSAGCDRLALLQAFAEVAIVRESGWDYLKVRREADRHSLSHDGCFVCRTKERAIEFHHVIQIQHGGSNASRNRVPLCSVCHDGVHPWLAGTTLRKVGGWSHVSSLGEGVMEELRRKTS